ncbi:hypothetical protein OCV88_01030 [Brotonthovivens ammoniilytica]|uniref:Uncharacterized protein n=1 Tax=Brotonthovivens ammoniilytica TaxID=2981725 RepID=A0ABT2TG99_9FIRM|nr:hypothetical protein [Brotonthovivens ammoniilytica]MCU6760916.1 hypothetical protein [Brotonthovivens ammoniilytica]
MKKIKQLLALLGVLLLAGLYISTLIFALIGSSQSMELLKVSLIFTIIVPVLLWVYSYIYKLMKHKDSH